VIGPQGMALNFVIEIPLHGQKRRFFFISCISRSLIYLNRNLSPGDNTKEWELAVEIIEKQYINRNYSEHYKN